VKFIVLILIFTLFFFNIIIACAEENDYGEVKAWFNGNNATLETIQGIKLKIGEPVEVKIEVISKIEGDVTFKIYEPGKTKAFDIIDGPDKQDEWIDNLNVKSGWSKSYVWIIAPNGAWKNGNAPLNIFVQFNKGMDNKQIDFTIANPHILIEQYTGAVTQKPTLRTSETGALPSQPKAAPFISALMAGVLVLAAARR